MRAFRGLVKKEFIQIFRDINMLRLIFAIPIIQLLLFGYVVNLDVKKITLDVYDFDQSQESREFVNSTKAGDYFILQKGLKSIFELEDNFQSSSSDMTLIIPNDFSEKLKRKENPIIILIADGSDANATGIGSGYLRQITQRYLENYYGIEKVLDVKFDIFYNPESESIYYMVPGIVATLLTMITVMLTSMAIVREREVVP